MVGKEPAAAWQSFFHTRNAKHTPPCVKRVEGHESTPGMNAQLPTTVWTHLLFYVGAVGGFQISLGVQTGCVCVYMFFFLQSNFWQ